MASEQDARFDPVFSQRDRGSTLENPLGYNALNLWTRRLCVSLPRSIHPCSVDHACAPTWSGDLGDGRRTELHRVRRRVIPRGNTVLFYVISQLLLHPCRLDAGKASD